MLLYPLARINNKLLMLNKNSSQKKLSLCQKKAIYQAIKTNACDTLRAYPTAQLNQLLPTDLNFFWHPAVIAIHFNAYECLEYILSNKDINTNQEYDYFLLKLEGKVFHPVPVKATLLTILTSASEQYSLQDFKKTVLFLLAYGELIAKKSWILNRSKMMGPLSVALTKNNINEFNFLLTQWLLNEKIAVEEKIDIIIMTHEIALSTKDTQCLVILLEKISPFINDGERCPFLELLYEVLDIFFSDKRKDVDLANNLARVLGEALVRWNNDLGKLLKLSGQKSHFYHFEQIVLRFYRFAAHCLDDSYDKAFIDFFTQFLQTVIQNIDTKNLLPRIILDKAAPIVPSKSASDFTKKRQRLVLPKLQLLYLIASFEEESLCDLIFNHFKNKKDIVFLDDLVHSFLIAWLTEPKMGDFVAFEFALLNKYGANFNKPISLSSNFTIYPLQLALYSGACIEIINILLNYPVTIQPKDSDFCTFELAMSNKAYLLALFKAKASPLGDKDCDPHVIPKMFLKCQNDEIQSIFFAYLLEYYPDYFYSSFSLLIKYAILLNKHQSVAALYEAVLPNQAANISFCFDEAWFTKYIYYAIKTESESAFDQLFSYYQTKYPSTFFPKAWLKASYAILMTFNNDHFINKLSNANFNYFLEETEHPFAAAILSHDVRLAKIIAKKTPHFVYLTINAGQKYIGKKPYEIPGYSHIFNNINTASMSIFDCQNKKDEYDLPLFNSTNLFIKTFASTNQEIDDSLARATEGIKILLNNLGKDVSLEKEYALQFLAFSFFECMRKKYLDMLGSGNVKFLSQIGLPFISVNKIRNLLAHSYWAISKDHLLEIANAIKCFETPDWDMNILEQFANSFEYPTREGLKINVEIIQDEISLLRQTVIPKITTFTKKGALIPLNWIYTMTWAVMRIGECYQQTRHLVPNWDFYNDVLQKAYELRCYLAHEDGCRNAIVGIFSYSEIFTLAKLLVTNEPYFKRAVSSPSMSINL